MESVVHSLPEFYYNLKIDSTNETNKVSVVGAEPHQVELVLTLSGHKLTVVKQPWQLFLQRHLCVIPIGVRQCRF